MRAMHPILDRPSFDLTNPAARDLHARLAEAYPDWPSIEGAVRPHLALGGLDRQGAPLVLWTRVLDALCRAARLRAFLEAQLADPQAAGLHVTIGVVLSAGSTGAGPKHAPDIPRGTQALGKLLGQMFSGQELKRLIRYNYPDLSDEINWDSALKTIVFDVVEGLGRNNSLDARLFQLLLQERPGRSKEIHEVAADFGG